MIKHLIKFKDGVGMGFITNSLRILMSLYYLEISKICIDLQINMKKI